MKTVNKKLLAFLLVVVCMFAFAGCGKGDSLSGTATIALNSGDTTIEYQLDLEQCGFAKGDNVYQALVWLAENKGVDFSATTTFASTGYDAFLNSIGIVNPAFGSTEYVGLFHNVELQKDVSAWALPDRQYKNTTVYYSGVGVGALKLADGLVVFITLLSW